MPRPLLIVITGPTAIGKTALALDLAEALETEILSADSRQFFREMSIGTAKPTSQELSRVRHHFINNLSITEDYDAGKYESEAIPLLSRLFKQFPYLILAGGSGMYIDAVCKGFDPLPDVGEAERERLNNLFKQEGLAPLQKLLLEKDPDHYANVDLNNPHRLIRALEVTLVTGKPYSSFRKGKGTEREFDILRINLEAPRDQLYERINQRVDRMMEQGFLNEAESLFNHRHLNALQTVGYKELFDYLDGKSTLGESIGLIKQNTRRFAKRQTTWFRKEPALLNLNPLAGKSLLPEILRHIKHP